jgi:O-acetylhomoserine/O-acetylserine sulfhydrylase-like pyridoxal-dependent enzyme
VLGGWVPGYSYSRIDNPTGAAFAAAVIALEASDAQDVGAEPFAYGMVAISTSFGQPYGLDHPPPTRRHCTRGDPASPPCHVRLSVGVEDPRGDLRQVLDVT